MLRWMSFIIVFLFCSCGQAQKESVLTELSKIKSNNIKFKDCDRVVIRYWRSSDANDYGFEYSNGLVKISRNEKPIGRVENGDGIVSELAELINVIYFEQNYAIEIGRDKLNGPIITDYSEINVLGFRKNSRLFKISTSIGEEEYNIKYSTQFKRLIKLLNDLLVDQ